MARQKEAFASEREKFDQEKKRLYTEQEEEQKRSEKKLEASHRTVSELRTEVRQREDELRKWGENEIQIHNEYEVREELFRELEKLRRVMSGLRAGNPIPINYGPSVKNPNYEFTTPPFTSGENSYESTGDLN